MFDTFSAPGSVAIAASGERPAQRIARLTKPRHGVLATLEHHHGESQNSRKSHETIRSRWIQSSTTFPARAGPQTDLKEAILLSRRQSQRRDDRLIGAHGKTSLYLGEQVNARSPRAEQSWTAQEVDDTRWHKEDL
ncbi:MAG: hypothetical protein WDO68_06835 [Gammaproteobacteria bacterium]